MTQPTREDVARVAGVFLQGCTVAQIAAALDVSAHTVRRAGIRGVPRKRLSGEESAQVVTLTKLGYSAERIGLMLGVSERTVQRHRDAHGITRPHPQPLSEDEKRCALALFEDGASAAEVARTIGRSSAAVRRRFGRAWTRQQVSEYISATRRFRGILERTA